MSLPAIPPLAGVSTQVLPEVLNPRAGTPLLKKLWWFVRVLEGPSRDPAREATGGLGPRHRGAHRPASRRRAAPHPTPVRLPVLLRTYLSLSGGVVWRGRILCSVAHLGLAGRASGWALRGHAVCAHILAEVPCGAVPRPAELSM